jgi:DNA-binding transcriptional LysR family regulator
MALSLEALQVIDAIDRRGSFAAAAKELGRVPSALTYLVRKLEGDLDILVFDRRPHRARLTPAGLELLREGRNLLRAADELERRVQRVASGWEVELRIAVDGMVCFEAVAELLQRFYAGAPGTRIRLSTEVLSGTWDALVGQRADLALGLASVVPGSAETASGFLVRPLGTIEQVFAVAPLHPLASLPEPLPPEVIRHHRAVAVGDTARNLPRVTVNLLRGQDVLTVASVEDKISAQLAGLGCGYLPLERVARYIEEGRLVPKLTTLPRLEIDLYYAVASSARGLALRWFLDELENPAVRRALLARPAGANRVPAAPPA